LKSRVCRPNVLQASFDARNESAKIGWMRLCIEFRYVAKGDAAVLSVEYKVNLLAPAVGERMRAIGRVIKSGRTLVVCTGEVIGPGDYVYEPAGNVDSWKVVGNTPLIVFVAVTGAVEYLDAHGAVTTRYTASRLLDLYREHCVANGLDMLDLVD